MKIYDSNANKEPLLKEAFLKLEHRREKEVSLIAVDEKGVEIAYLATIGPCGIEFHRYAEQRLTGKGYMLYTTFEDNSGSLQVVPG